MNKEIIEKLKKLENSLKKYSVSALVKKFPEYKKMQEDFRIKNPNALSSQDFTFFCYLRESERLFNGVWPP